MARILIAPDSFKGSATSIEVASAIAQGWQSVRPDDLLTQIPCADGGEGTLLAIEIARPDAVRNYCPEVSPDAYWLLINSSTAIVELAQVSGLPLLATQDPLGAHTFAFGQVLANAARDTRVHRIYCALGGSASTDAGVGALTALGFEFLDEADQHVGLGGEQLSKIAKVLDRKAVAPPIGGVTLLVDVDSPLLGIHGAAPVFAPQKGATQGEIVQLELGLQRFSKLIDFDDSPGSGAAGGTAYGLHALWGATIESGSVWIAEICGVTEAIRGCDLVITGEGKLDAQSERGKVVGHISDIAAAAEVPIAYCVGSIDGEFPIPNLAGIALSELAGSTKEAIENPQRYLFEAGVKLANFL